MKLVTTLKDRPGFLHVVPLFDLFALAIMLLLLGPMFFTESGITVKVPSSRFQMQRYERSVVVTIGPGDSQALLYLGKEPIKLENLPKRLKELRETEAMADALVLLKSDIRTSVGLERMVSEIILAEGFKIALVGDSKRVEPLAPVNKP